MGYFFMILIGFIIVGIYGMIENEKDEEKKLEQEKIEKEKEEEARKQREFHENMQKEIIEFAIKHGKDEIQREYAYRDMYYSKAVNRAMLYSMVTPQAPTYTQGVVKGSIADNISVLANAQKKREYDEEVKEHNQAFNDFISLKEDYLSSANRILAILRELPDSQRYVSYEASKKVNNESYLNNLERKMRFKSF